ncbi:MAG: hypothetical protein IPK50_13150 [Fibrobacterota bacterium]|nr:hypothetical protein [Fibrobacterota bacterium]QQS03256.1 MAG: hypothetical protein IPK50_13150 [Fibrobacterota bacterium]
MPDSSLRGAKAIYVTLFVLLLSSLGWCTGAHLDRHVWVRFDGQGLLVHDKFSPGIRHPQRLSVREPLELQSASDFRQQAVLTSIEPGERGFPVGGTPTLFLESRVAGVLWYSIPVSPTEGELSDASVLVHTGPGWKVIATTGGGTGHGAWLDAWEWKEILWFLVFAAVVGLVFGWRAGLLVGAGLAMVGTSSIGLGWLNCATLLFCLWGLRRWLRPSWGVVLGRMLLLAGIAIAGWLAFYAAQQTLAIADPVGHMDRTRGLGVSSICWDDLDAEYTEQTLDWSNQGNWYGSYVPTGGIIGGLPFVGHAFPEGDKDREAWVPDEDSSFYRGASPSAGDPIWYPTMACRYWSGRGWVPPLDSTGSPMNRVVRDDDDSSEALMADTPGVAAKQRMGMLVLPPTLAAFWRLLPVLLLGGAFGICQRGFRGVRIRPPAPGSAIMPGSVLVVFLMAMAGRVQAEGIEGKGLVEREFRFTRDWSVRTILRDLQTEDAVLRIPLLPGEVLLEGVEVRDGAVVVSRKPFTILAETSGANPQRVRCDSLRSGSWSGVSGRFWHHCGRDPASWSSRLEVDTVLSLHAAGQAGWREQWRFFSSNRWHLEFQGKRLAGPWSSAGGRSMVIEPGFGDSVRIDFRKTRVVPFETTRLNEARMEFRDPFLSEAVLHLRLHAAAPDTVRIWLPSGSSNVSCRMEGRFREQDGLLSFPIPRGASQVDLRWVMPSQRGVLRRSPKLTISVDGVNANLRMPIEAGAWIPALHGPGVGPSESGWMGFLAFGLLNLFVVLWFRIYRASVDLLFVWLGATIFGPSFFVVGGAVLCLHVRQDAQRATLPFGLGRITAGRLAIALLVSVLGSAGWLLSLLGTPPVPVALGWYNDTAGPEFMRPWLIVLPGWAWKAGVLTWTVWLVSVGARIVVRCISLAKRESSTIR